MRSTMEPQRRQNSAIFSTAASSAPGGGVNKVQRPWNSVVKPESGPEYSVPARGCAGTKCTPAGTNGLTSRMTDCFVDPTSVSTAPGANTGPIASAIDAKAPTGAHSMTQSASATALAGSSSTRSAKPSSTTRSSVFCVRALTMISAARSPRSLAMRATEEPISPIPSSANRRKSGSATGLLHEIRYSVDDHAAFLGGADGDAQAVRQAVCSNTTRDQAAPAHEHIRRIGMIDSAEIGEHEIAFAGPDLDAGGLDPGRQFWPPNRIVLAALFNPAFLLQRRDPGCLRSERKIELAADAYQHFDPRRWSITPADADSSQPKHLGKRAGHDRVVRRVDQPLARVIVIARDVLGIRGVDHQQDFRRQSGAKACHLRLGDHRTRRIVWVGKKHRLGRRRHRREHRIQIRLQISFRNFDHPAAGVDPGDVINGEAVPRQ